MKILFINPTGFFTGAEVFLKNLARYFQKTEGYFYFPAKGTLADYLSRDFKVYVPIRTTRPYLGFFLALVARVFKADVERLYLKRLHRKLKPDIWYINTLNSHRFCKMAQEMGIPYVVHFHELPSMYERVRPEELKHILSSAKLCIGCSSLVLEKLQTLGARRTGKFFEVVDIAQVHHDRGLVSKEIEQHEITASTKFTWVMSGSMSYRKGLDFIPQIAERLKDVANIVWIGYGRSGFRYYVEQQIDQFDLSNVFLVGDKHEDYYAWMDSADGFMLTSREDPFPLVMIEAAALGKPIVSFDSGGAGEFILPGMGEVVENYNIEAFVQAMQRVMQPGYEFSATIATDRAAQFDAATKVHDWENQVEEVLKESL